MSHSDWQYCAQCGEELIEKREPSTFENEDRILLVCPNKKYDEFSLRSIFRRDRHTRIVIDYADTILNYDPVTGERIKREPSKRLSKEV